MQNQGVLPRVSSISIYNTTGVRGIQPSSLELIETIVINFKHSEEYYYRNVTYDVENLWSFYYTSSF